MRGAGTEPRGPEPAGSTGEALKRAQPQERRSSGFGTAMEPKAGKPKGTALYYGARKYGSGSSNQYGRYGWR